MSDPTNVEIAALLDELGDLYELDGAIVHRVVAYRNAAKAVREAPTSIAALTREGRVTELPGIGKTLEEKFRDLLDTGTIPAVEKLRAKFPPGLVAMTRLPGLGPKRARRLFDDLGIDSLEALRAAAEGHRLRELKGFGEKFELAVIEALDAGLGEATRHRVALHKALVVGEAIVEALRRHPAADKVELAGSARRLADSVKDLDIIATSPEPETLAAALAGLDAIESVGNAGAAGARAVTHTGLPIDLRIVAPEQFGNLLQHFTGSKQHNMALRELAVRKGLHVSEYGVLDDNTGETHHCATEEEVYALVGLPCPPPELREERGEVDPDWTVPANLVTEADLKGDLHSHTTASDGRNSIEEMALAARDRGIEYLVITDHSATHGFGNHVTPDELRRQIERVRAVDARVEGLTLLIGTETNILPDGSPDYEDDLLAELDWVVGSIHTSFSMGSAEMTKRIVAALENPWVDCLGHPTGRLIEQRDGYTFDLDAVLAAAARTGTMLEINANPNRRDLRDTHARAAAAAGIPIVVNTDAHGTDTLRSVPRWGIATARRAGLTVDQVANTRPWDELRAMLHRAARD